MSEPRESPIAASVKLAYAAPAFALALVGIPIYVYIPKFYTDVVGVPIGVLGALILGIRLFDAVTDPLIGIVSDSTETRFGRRRPFILLGSVLLAAAIYCLFNPVPGSATHQTVWFGWWFFSVFLFWTLVEVPYASLGPEISFDYHARIGLFAWRDGALIAGTLVAAASPALVSSLLDLSASPADERTKFFWISVCYAPLLVLLAGWCVFTVREKTRHRMSPGPGLRDGLAPVLANRPFLILLVAYTIAAFGSNLPATLILYYVEYVLRSESADLFLGLYFMTGILCLPVWVLLANRIGKKRAWILSMAINTGAFIGVFFLGPGDAVIYGVLVVVSGRARARGTYHRYSVIGLGVHSYYKSRMPRKV